MISQWFQNSRTKVLYKSAADKKKYTSDFNRRTDGIGESNSPSLLGVKIYVIWLFGSVFHLQCLISFSLFSLFKMRIHKMQWTTVNLNTVTLNFGIIWTVITVPICIFHYFVPNFIRLIWSSDNLNTIFRSRALQIIRGVLYISDPVRGPEIINIELGRGRSDRLENSKY